MYKRSRSRHRHIGPHAACKRRGPIALLGSSKCHLIVHIICGDSEAGPVPSQVLTAATLSRWPIHLHRRRLLSRVVAGHLKLNRTVLRAGRGAKCRGFCSCLAVGDHWNDVRHLGHGERVVFRRHRSVEVQSEAPSAGVREKVC